MAEIKWSHTSYTSNNAIIFGAALQGVPRKPKLGCERTVKKSGILNSAYYWFTILSHLILKFPEIFQVVRNIL